MSDEAAIIELSGRERPLRIRMTAAERREQLIHIGRSVFAEKGFEAAAVEEIADRAKVSKPVVYEHFGGKEGLYAVVVDREVRGLIERIERALRAPHPRSALEEAADAFLSYVEDEEDGFRVLVRDAPLGTPGGTLPSVLGHIADNVELLLARELKAAGYHKSFAPVLARALVGMVALTGQWWQEVGRPPRRVVAAQLVNLAWNGLKDLDHDPGKRRAKQAERAARKDAKKK